MTALGVNGVMVVTGGGFISAVRNSPSKQPAIELFAGEGLYRKLERVREQVEQNAAEMGQNESSPLRELLDYIVRRDNRSRKPICPKRGGEMFPQYGARNQSWFWGCKAYKDDSTGCRDALPLSATEEQLVLRVYSGPLM